MKKNVTQTLLEKSALAARRFEPSRDPGRHLEAGGIKRLILSALLGLALAACGQGPEVVATRKATEEGQARAQQAEAMFAERCKKAGVFIHRTAENVEGVLLMKLRPKEINYGDQFKLDDPYGNDSGGETYLKTFFSGFYRNSSPPPKGYRYAEAVDPADGKRYRYTGSMKAVTHTASPLIGGDGRQFVTTDFVLDKTPAPGESPRYGVTYDDISTKEERDHWIAGSSLKVIDLKTNEVMAERIGYMLDRGQGERGGGRSPWLLAARNACPEFRSAPGIPPIQTDQTRMFVVSVLHPTKEQ